MTAGHANALSCSGRTSLVGKVRFWAPIYMYPLRISIQYISRSIRIPRDRVHMILRNA
jgi:hypothetical protein